MLNRSEVKNHVISYKYELTIFGFLLTKIFKLDVINEKLFYFPIRFTAALILLAFVSWALGGIIKNLVDNAQKGILIIVALCLASYLSNSVLLLDRWFMPSEVFVNSFVVISVLLVFYIVDKPKIKWLLPVICFSCTALQPLSILRFMPAIIILLIYNIVSGKKGDEYKDLLASSLIAAAVAFLFFGSKTTFKIPIEKDLISQELEQILLNIIIILPAVEKVGQRDSL